MYILYIYFINDFYSFESFLLNILPYEIYVFFLFP